MILMLSGCENDVRVDACADNVILNESPCQSFTHVTPPCIIQEVTESVDGNELRKYVYYHDGLNYSRIDIYQKGVSENEFPEDPFEIVTMTYESDQIKDVTIQPAATPTSHRKLSYEYADMKVAETFELVEGGVVTYTEHHDQLFLVDPKDSIYLSEGDIDILREYKAGNNTRFAFEADSGQCIINKQRWVFTTKAIFDLNQNVFRNYAVRFPLGQETGYAAQFWFGNNRNNIVATVNPHDSKDKSISCYTFLRNGDQVWIKEYEVDGAYLYHYTYKYSCE